MEETSISVSVLKQNWVLRYRACTYLRQKLRRTSENCRPVSRIFPFWEKNALAPISKVVEKSKKKERPRAATKHDDVETPNERHQALVRDISKCNDLESGLRRGAWLRCVFVSFSSPERHHVQSWRKRDSKYIGIGINRGGKLHRHVWQSSARPHYSRTVACNHCGSSTLPPRGFRTIAILAKRLLLILEVSKRELRLSRTKIRVVVHPRRSFLRTRGVPSMSRFRDTLVVSFMGLARSCPMACRSTKFNEFRFSCIFVAAKFFNQSMQLTIKSSCRQYSFILLHGYNDLNAKHHHNLGVSYLTYKMHNKSRCWYSIHVETAWGFAWSMFWYV